MKNDLSNVPQSKEDISKVVESSKLPSRMKEKFQRIGEKIIEQHAKATAQDIRDRIAPDGQLPPQQMWLPCAPMPTDMCRVSPFFPVNRQDVGNREFIRDMVIASSSWGKILYTGPKLTTYEEDVLTAVLAILDMIEHREKTEEHGQATYTYRGPVRKILKLVNPNTKHYSSKEYKRVLSALELMLSSVIKMYVARNSSKGGKSTKTIEMANILSWAKWDESVKEVTVTVNPYFYECFARGSVTLLDVLQRSELRSPIAKSLYRFIMSHKGNVWEGHFLTLAAALNLDLEQPQKEIKRYIKRAIKALISHKLLEATSGIARDSDIAKLHRTQSAKQRRKQLE